MTDIVKLFVHMHMFKMASTIDYAIFEHMRKSSEQIIYNIIDLVKINRIGY